MTINKILHKCVLAHVYTVLQSDILFQSFLLYPSRAKASALSFSNHHRNEFEKFKSILQRRHSSFWIQRSVGSLFKFVGKRRMLHSVLIDLLIYIFYRLVRVIVQLESDLFLLGRKLLKSDKIYEETGKPVVEILNIIARRDIFN